MYICREMNNMLALSFRILIVARMMAFAIVSVAQDSLLVSYKLNLVKDPITKMYGYAFKEQNITSPIHGMASTAVNMLGKSGSAFIGKSEAENIDWAVPPQYEDASNGFKENMAMVKIGGKIGFIDMYNRFVIEPIFDGDMDMDGFCQGIVAVKKDGKWGYINKMGETVIPFEFDEAENFDNDVLAAVKMGDLWGAIDISGTVVLQPCKKTKLALKTNPVSNKEWREAKDLARERKANGSFDHKMRELHEASAAMNELIALGEREELTYTETSDGDSMGINDQWGRTIVPEWFTEIKTQTNEGTFIVKRNNLYGAYLYNGSKLIRPCFDSMAPFEEGKSIVTIEGITGWIDTQGRLDPQLLPSLTQFGIDMEKESKSKARRIYERVLEVNPEYATAYNNIALIDIAWSDYNKGMRKLKLAHELAPNDTIISNNLKWAKESRKERRKERWNDALEVVTAVLGIATTTYATYSALNGGGTASSGGSGTYTANSQSSSSASSAKKSSSGKICTACAGTGRCHSSGVSNKYHCGGSGTCMNCGGRGYDYAGDGTHIKCTWCNGNGKCKWCKGTGKCSTCGGSGK